jgi:serine/threonine protein phosphatase PrpC
MAYNHRSDKAWPLSNLPPVGPIKENDYIGSIAYQGGVVQYATFQGKRPYQEDRWLIKAGLGATNGAEAQNFLRKMFKKATEDTRGMFAGSTATAAIITPDHQLNIAYLGDSPVILIIRDPATGVVMQTEYLIRPHHPGDPQEKARIEAAGGTVVDECIIGKNGRWLALSRSFGDAPFKGVSTEIEMVTRDLSAEIQEGMEVYVCVASDGLTAVGGKPNLAFVLERAVLEEKTDRLAEIFATYAYQSGSTDNITALVTRVPEKMTESVFLNVDDGDGGYETADAVQKSFAKRLELPPPPQL